MIEQYTGTIGSGKSYHALERIIEALDKGKHVIANFPLNFPENMIKKGYADRFMYVPDDFLMGAAGVSFLYKTSKEKFFGNEGACLVVIDEAGNYFAPIDFAHPDQKLWRTFFTQSRKMGFDFILVSQTDKQVNRTIRACVEYEVIHRKANNIFPFKYLPITLFSYVKYWKQNRERLGSESSVFVKRFAALYDTHMMFGQFDKQIDFDISKQLINFDLHFGNCSPDEVTLGGTPQGEGPSGDSSGEPEGAAYETDIESQRESRAV